MNEILSGDLECDYNRGEPLHCHALYYNLYTRGPIGLSCMLILIITDEHPAYPYSATDVARCRDGDVSRVSLKYDAAECLPGLLSMEWYPSIIVPGCRRMFTLVGEHGMVPLLVPGVFPPVGFSMQAHMLFRDTWYHPYITSCFCFKTFLLPLSGNRPPVSF